MSQTNSTELINDLVGTATDILGGKPKGKDRAAQVAEFFGFESKHRIFTFDADGKPFQSKLEWPNEPVTTPVVASGARNPVSFSLPLEVEGVKTDFPLNLGIVGVSGGTEVGKSTFIRALSRLMAIRRLLAVEPHDSPEELTDTPYFSSADGALVEVVRQHYFGDSTVLHAIDSLRAPLFETDGPAGEKGVIMPFFTQLTRVSSTLANAGITALATINPMNENQEFVESFLKKLSAALPTTILLEDYTKQGHTETFIGTISARPNRMKRRFRLRLNGQDEKPDTSPSGIEFRAASVELVNFTTNALINATRKAI